MMDSTFEYKYHAIISSSITAIIKCTRVRFSKTRDLNINIWVISTLLRCQVQCYLI